MAIVGNGTRGQASRRSRLPALLKRVVVVAHVVRLVRPPVEAADLATDGHGLKGNGSGFRTAPESGRGSQSGVRQQGPAPRQEPPPGHLVGNGVWSPAAPRPLRPQPVVRSKVCETSIERNIGEITFIFSFGQTGPSSRPSSTTHSICTIGRVNII